MMRELVGALFKLLIGQLLFLEHHRNCFGGSHRLRRAELRHRRKANRLHRVVPVPQQGLPFGSAENVQPPDSPIGLCNRCRQQPTSRSPSAATLSPSNRSVAYSITPLIPAGKPAAVRCSATLSVRSERIG